MKQLIVHILDVNAKQAEWQLVEQPAKSLLQSGDVGNLATIAEEEIDKITLLTPTADVLFTQAIIPSNNLRQVRLAAPNVVEEQVSQPIDQVHCAVGAKLITGEYPVVLIAKDKLEQYINFLAEYHLEPDELYPDCYGIPGDENNINIFLANGLATCRLDSQDGFAIEVEHLDLILQGLNKNQLEATGKVVSCSIYLANPDVVIPNFSIDCVESKVLNRPTLSWMIDHLDKNAINMLQGNFASAKTKKYDQKRWKIAGYLVGTFIVLLFGLAFVDYWRLSHENKALNAKMEQLYLEAFPQATRIVNPMQQLKAGLDQLRKATGNNVGSNLIRWLDIAAKEVNQLNTIKINRLQFRNNNLELELIASNIAQVELFRQKLSMHPELTIEISSAVQEGQETIGRLLIKSKQS